jgi:hypothetical protein
MLDKGRFSAGIDDIVILPLAAITFVVRKLLRALLTALIHIIDWLFPILLQIMRFPLFTLRILGDALAWLAKAVVRILPVGGPRRAAWRERISEAWAWLRAKISYKAFEEWLHHAFESGMAWVFRRCKALTPRAALMVLCGAVLWLPISFGVATAMHAILFAKALTWPAWTQLLHPFATVIAKSKLLVLPVYPAAWPQAKRHPFMQSVLRFGAWLGTLSFVRKTGYRYRQMEHAGAVAADAWKHTAAYIGLTRLWDAVLAGINGAAAWTGRTAWALAAGAVALLSKIPLFGSVVQRYTAHYDDANRAPVEPLSERTRDFFARWSVKFTAQYYEDREREEAAKGNAAA